MIEIGVTLPGDDPRIGVAARRAEDLGFESVWTPDLVLGDGMPGHEAIVALAAASATTDRVRLGFGVLVLPPRPVAWTAAQLATLQRISTNRVILGVGVGGFPDAPWWRALGVSGRDRGRRMDSALDVLGPLIAGKPTELGGVAVRLAPGVPVPPVLVAGNSDAALRRATSRGDGWFPSLLPPHEVAARLPELRALAAERGRPVPAVTVGGHAMPGTDAGARDAYVAFTDALARMHGLDAAIAEGIVIAGGAPEMADRLAAYAEAGAARMVLSVDGDDWPRRVELLAEATALLG